MSQILLSFQSCYPWWDEGKFFPELLFYWTTDGSIYSISQYLNSLALNLTHYQPGKEEWLIYVVKEVGLSQESPGWSITQTWVLPFCWRPTLVYCNWLNKRPSCGNLERSVGETFGLKIYTWLLQWALTIKILTFDLPLHDFYV